MELFSTDISHRSIITVLALAILSRILWIDSPSYLRSRIVRRSVPKLSKCFQTPKNPKLKFLKDQKTQICCCIVNDYRWCISNHFPFPQMGCRVFYNKKRSASASEGLESIGLSLGGHWIELSY